MRLATVAGAAGLQFMGAFALSGTIDSVFPKGHPLVQGRFAVTGRMSRSSNNPKPNPNPNPDPHPIFLVCSPEARVELRYGRGGDVIHRAQVTLSKDDTTRGHLVTWYHAAQQVNPNLNPIPNPIPNPNPYPLTLGSGAGSVPRPKRGRPSRSRPGPRASHPTNVIAGAGHP